MKRLLTFLILFCFSPLFSQSFSEADIKKLAKEIDTKIKGVDINGMTARGCISLGRTLVYQYDVPDNWSFPENMKQEIITNFKTAGLSKIYFKNDVDINFYYYHQNSLIQRINIKSNELSPYNFELSEHVDLSEHPKAKEVSFKLKYPKEWEILEGDRPNIVKKFSLDSNSFLILIKDNFTFISRKEARDFFSDEQFSHQLLQELVSVLKNPKFLNQEIVTVDNYPAMQYTVEGEMERSGMEFNILMKGWFLFYEDKIISFQAGALDRTEFESLESLYSLIINSVVFPEQYN